MLLMDGNHRVVRIRISVGLLLIGLSAFTLTSLPGCGKPSIKAQRLEISRRLNNNWGDTSAHLEAARLDEIDGDLKSSLMHLGAAISLGYNSPLVFTKRALILFSLKQYDYAAIEETKAIELGSTQGRHFRGMCYFLSGEYRSALTDWDSTDSPGWKAECSFVLGEYPAAIQGWVTDMKALQSRDHLKDIMSAYIAIGDSKKALLYADSMATSGKEDSAESYYYRGVIHLQIGDPLGAVVNFRRAIDSHVFEGLSQFYWAQASEKMKENRSAILHYDAALQNGFAFLDLVDAKDFRRKQVEYDSGRARREAKIELLNRIRTRSKILTQEEELVARERMAAILPLQGYREEYRSLFRMFIVLDNEQMDLLLWKRDPMILP